MDSSPRDHQSSTCVDASGASDFDQMHVYDSSHDLHRAVTIKRWTHLTIGRTESRDRDHPLTGSAIGWRRQDVEEPTIAVRSSRDCAAIKPRSHFFRWGIVSSRSAGDRRRIRTTIVCQSRPDRGPIVVEIVAIWKPNRSQTHADSSRN